MILLDTCSLIWMLYQDENLSQTATATIEESDEIFVSMASLWEIAIKQSIGKIGISDSVPDIVRTCEDEDISILPIKPSHIEKTKSLPKIHRDPFDRLVISQAICERMSLVTSDLKIKQYPEVTVIW